MNTLRSMSGSTNSYRGHKIPGGIKPPTYKHTSLRSRIMPVPIAENLILPLQQHRSEAAIPMVKVGDQVLKYQKIGHAVSKLSVVIHAPTSGTITAIAEASVANESGEKALCIHLQADGKDNALAIKPVYDYRAMSHLDLLAMVEEAGICGLGGAGFPTAEKLRLCIDKGVELLIINAVECEPYITADEALIRERAEAVIIGSEVLQAICLARRCVVAIENDKTDAIAALTTVLQSSSIELFIVPAKYTTGGEKQLIQALTGREVATDTLPVDIGVTVQNAGTAYAVYKAIIEGTPCISRITTVTGAPLQTPKNFEALIGTPVSYLFDLCGINNAIHTMTIMGGSLRGIVLCSIDVPVVKTTNCLIAASNEEFPPAQPERACIRCGFCATACPASLLPQQLYAFARSQNWQQLQEHGLFDCIECGACAYVCPSHIPLVQYYRASKTDLREYREKQLQSEQWEQRFQYHQYRSKKGKDDVQDQDFNKNESHKTNTGITGFSREQAKKEIAAAVARVKSRRANLITSSRNGGDKKD